MGKPTQDNLFAALGLRATPTIERFVLDPAEIVIVAGEGEDLAQDAARIGASIETLGRYSDPVVIRERLYDAARETQVFRYRALAGRTRIVNARQRGDTEINVLCYSDLSRPLQSLVTLSENHNRRIPWTQTVQEMHQMIFEDRVPEDSLREWLKSICHFSRQQIDRYLNIIGLPTALYNYVISGKLSQTLANTVASPRFDAARRRQLAQMAQDGLAITNDTLRGLYTAQVAPGLLDALTADEEPPVSEGEIARAIAALDAQIAATHPNSKARALLKMALHMIEQEQ